jgi:uncharacterized repeat protein (TIGR01451 family)
MKPLNRSMNSAVRACLAVIVIAITLAINTTIAAGASAPVYVDTNTNGQFDAGETNAAFSGGNNGSTHIRRFDLPADRVTAQDTIIVNFGFIDNSVAISINGTQIFSPLVGQLENTGTGETRITIAGTYLTTPWVANVNGLPRLRVTISPAGIILQGSRTTTSTTLETMTTTTGGVVIPTFITGQNTLQVVNQNGGGPDAISGSAAASFTPLVRAIAMTKLANLSSVTNSGTNVTYSLQVTNNGNVPITGLTLTDSIAPVVCPITGNATVTSLAASASTTCLATYTVTQNDLDTRGGGDGDIDNTASVSGTQQGQTVSANVSAAVSLLFNPSLSFDKSTPVSTPTPLTLNQIVTYYYDATNNGNVTLSGVNISDVHGGNNTVPIPQNEYVFFDGSPLDTSSDTTPNDGIWSLIRPGDTVRFTGSYTVSQQDIDLLQ